MPESSVKTDKIVVMCSLLEVRRVLRCYCVLIGRQAGRKTVVVRCVVMEGPEDRLLADDPHWSIRLEHIAAKYS